MKKIFMIIAISTGLQVAVNAQELLNIRFHGTCSPGDPNQTGVSGKRNSTKMTDADLIAQCVGNGTTASQLNGNYALVYNTAADSIQVVNVSDGSAVCDVFQFAGGTGVTNNGQADRFVFVFSPGQTEAIGSAVITERSNNGNGRSRFIGKLQFTMPEAGLGGDTNSTDGSSTDTNNVAIVDTNGVAIISNAVQVCTGTFMTGSAFREGSSKLSKAQKRAIKQANKLNSKNDQTTQTQQNKNKNNNQQTAEISSNTTTNTRGTNSLITSTISTTSTVSTNVTSITPPPSTPTGGTNQVVIVR